jgi:acyl-[acyl carrier protein]--UDP-N-acetylglucosamine O-acyltransferase
MNSTYISKTATIGKDVVIGPFCHIGEGVAIGEGVEVGAFTIIGGLPVAQSAGENPLMPEISSSQLESLNRSKAY